MKAVAFFGFAAANSFAQATWAGVKQAAKDAGVSAKFFDPNFDAQTQVSQIQDATTSGQYQAFVIQANDGNAVIPAIQQAVKKGIAVVAEFTPIGSNYASLTRRSPASRSSAKRPSTTARSSASRDHGLQGPQPVQRRLPRGLQVAAARQRAHGGGEEGARDASNVKLVADVEGGYTQASGLKAAQDVLQAHSDVNVLIGSSQAIEGAQQAVKKVGKTGQIKLIGNGGSCQAVAGVKSGAWFATYALPETTSAPQGDAARDPGRQRAEGADDLQRRHADESAR